MFYRVIIEYCSPCIIDFIILPKEIILLIHSFLKKYMYLEVHLYEKPMKWKLIHLNGNFNIRYLIKYMIYIRNKQNLYSVKRSYFICKFS